MTKPDRIIALKRGDALWRPSKRDFLKSAAGALAAGAAACSPGSKEDDEKDNDQPPESDPVQPFEAAGVTYRVIDLVDYNGKLPDSGTNLAVVAYVKEDFFLRSFDGQGVMVVNHHESRIADQTSMTALKEVVATAVEQKSTTPAERMSMYQLFSKAGASAISAPDTTTQSGRRLQGSEARGGSEGRRLQGSSSSGRVSGRRMQGAEGRPEGSSSERDLGTVIINGQSYSNTRILETFRDGYTRVAHSDGTMLVRTDALPEIVRMQLPIEVPNPGFRPTTTSEATTGTTTTVTPSPRPAPTPPPQPPSSSGTRTYHYWRPN